MLLQEKTRVPTKILGCFAPSNWRKNCNQTTAYCTNQILVTEMKDTRTDYLVTNSPASFIRVIGCFIVLYVFSLQIIATEPQTATGFKDTTNVTIIIQDVNEFNPMYSESSYTAVVDDSNSVGTQVVKVSMQFS